MLLPTQKHLNLFVIVPFLPFLFFSHPTGYSLRYRSMECFINIIKKKNYTSTNAVNSLLEELDTWWRLSLSHDKDEKDAYEQIQILKVELKFLKTFLIYVGNWNVSDKVVGQLAGFLILDLDAAFKEAMRDFRVASEKGIERRAEYLDPAISKWQQKLKLFSPQIKTAYDCVLSYNNSFQSHSPSPLGNYVLWEDFSYSLRNNLAGLSYGKGKLLDYVMPHLCVMDEMIAYLRSFFYTIEDRNPKQHGYRDLLTHFGAMLVRAAHICYVCWVDSMDENMTHGHEMIIMIFDLLKKLKPNTPRVTEVCLNLLKALNLSNNQYLTKVDWAETFVQFVIPMNDQLGTLRKGLQYLMTLVIEATNLYKDDDDVKLLLMDITAMISELGSFGYLFHANKTIADMAKETYPVLFKLLGKMELLKAELFLMELLQRRITKRSIVKHRIDSFHSGLTLSRIILVGASQVKIKTPKPIWMHIEPVTRDAGYVYLSFLTRSVTEEKLRDELLRLLEKIKLFKMEILLEDLLSSHPSTPVNVKNQIETLYEGLTVLRTFLMDPLEESGKLILAHAQTVVRDMVSFYCSFHTKNDTDDKARDIILLLHKLVERIEPVNAKIKDIYLCVRSSSKSNFPKTNGLGFMDFLLKQMRELLMSSTDSIAYVKYQIHVIYREMGFLRSLLRDVEQCNVHLDLKNLVSSMVEVAYEVEYLLDSCVVKDGVLWYHSLWLSDLVEGIKLIKLKATEISMKTHGISIHSVPELSWKAITPATVFKIDEVLIDLADQKILMIDRLTRGSLQQDVLSIVGMPGLGKTTLAWKVYNDPSVTYHFHICAWCCVSPVYRKRELLLEILGHIVELTDNILEMSDEDLYLELYQCLKRKRYLIVMDDMWSIEAWNDLERSFPNDENGSRILITTRLPDLALKIKADSSPHPLRLFSDDESWKLLQKKIFQTKDCPDELVAVGKQIARSCNGLPLAVVTICGLLERTDMTLNWWKQVAESLCSRIADDPQTRCMDILELSYKHLPDYLKPCFLYLGAFLEDKEIPVRKLTWLWVAEGFIRDTGLASEEDLAEEYLRDLIGRSLVIASKRRSIGGVKTCRVHDMLRTLCLLRCKEESFLQWITGYDEMFAASYEDSDYGVDPSYSYPTNFITYEKRRLSICSRRNHFVMSRPCGSHVRSLLYFASSDSYPRCPYNISFIAMNFKLLRVLDLECINMGNSFPRGIEFLSHLRYLALCGDIDCVPASIANLWNLETLLVKGLKGKVILPDTIWSMAKLRHVHVYNTAAFSVQYSKTENPSQLENLVSLSSPSLSCDKDTENIMRRLPKLRKLRCLFSESRVNVGDCNQFPVLNFLTELESLKVLCAGRTSHPCKFDFPLKLKKLTLSKFRLPWDCISEIGRLPNLEVLKLLCRAFEGKVWNMKEGEFLKLKFLKLDMLNIAQWKASSDNLPNLQHLVLRNCRQLEEVPSGFADILTLEMIQVQLCRCSAEESVRRLKDEQLEMGNDELKVLINRSEWDF